MSFPNNTTLRDELDAQGYSTGNLTDDLLDFLQAHTSLSSDSIQDQLYAYLTLAGYTGTLGDMIDQWDGTLVDVTLALNLDFTTGTLDSRITYTGATLATMYDSTGTLVYKPHNLLRYSEQFDNGVWLKLEASVSADSVTAPDGTTTADKITDTITASSHWVYGQSHTLPITGPCTISVYLKYGNHQWVGIRGEWGVTTYSSFDLLNGVVGSVGSGHSSTMTAVGNGWYRCSITFTATSTSSGNLVFQFANSDTTSAASYAGSGSDYFYIWGAQMEMASSARTYNATTASAYYGPRFDYKYNGSTWEAAGLLIEEARTNLTKYSEAISDASWAKTNCTVSADATTAPDGNTTADKIIPSVGSVNPYVERSGTNGPAVTNTVVYTDSYYVKPGDFRYFSILEFSSGTGSGFVIFDTTTVTVSGAGNGATTADGAITSVGNGWYRISYTKASTVTGNWSIRLLVSGSGTSITNVTGDGSIGFYAWGAQTEAGAFPTSYIPTTSATVTRNADVAAMTGTNFSDWFNATEGTVYFYGQAISSSVSARNNWAISDNTLNETHYVSLNAGNIQYNVLDGGVSQASINKTFTAGNEFKSAIAYAVNDFAHSLNGSAVDTDISGTLPTVDRLYLGAEPRGNQGFMNGHIKTFKFFNVRKSDAELQSMTA